jgi:hypothetical protein
VLFTENEKSKIPQGTELVFHYASFCSIVQCSAVQSSAVQCSAVQCSAVLCRTVGNLGGDILKMLRSQAVYYQILIRVQDRLWKSKQFLLTVNFWGAIRVAQSTFRSIPSISPRIRHRREKNVRIIYSLFLCDLPLSYFMLNPD